MMGFEKGHIEMRIPPWLIFVVSFAATLWLWHSASHDNLEIGRARFHNRVALATERIREAMLDNEKVLRGCVGLFSVSEEITRSEWHRYVEGLDMKKTLPGVQGIGFARRVHPADLASHVLSIQSEGFPFYMVKPEGERAEYYPIVYLEPFRAQNLRAFGYDMFSEPTRRTAMERARDEAETVISGMVTLVQDIPGKDVQYGFLIYHPLYSADVASATLDDRRQKLLGFVYSPIRFGDFFNSLDYSESYWVGTTVYDGDEPDPAMAVYNSTSNPESEKISDSYVSSFEEIEKIPIFGRTWTVKFFSMPLFDRFSDSSKPIYILVFGFLISCLLAGACIIMRSRNQALHVVEQMKADLEIRIRERTEDLRKSNRLLRMLSDWNQALIRAESETHLLGTMTDLLINTGGYQCCLVGYPENDEMQSIRLIAQKGFEEDHLKTIDMSWAEAGVAARPLGKAIRSGHPVIINNVLTEPVCNIWRESAQSFGIASLAAIPLISSGPTIGVIGILSAETNAFDPDEMVILEEMAMDLAFGIETQRDRLAHLQAEKALIQSERNLRSAQALAHIGNWTLNPVTGEAWWSEEIHRILGHDPALPPPILQEQQAMFLPASWDRLQAEIGQTIKSGKPYDLELEYHQPEGKTGWAHALGQAKHDSLGKVVELHGTFQDITEQKRMEAEIIAHQENLEHLVAERTGLLKESEERYRVVIEKTGQIVYELNVLTGQTIHTGAIEELLGFSHDEFQVPFEQWLAGVHPDDRERVLPLLIAATKAQGAYSFEYRYLRKNNGYRFILDRGVSFADDEGKVFRVIGTMADITERKLFEEALELKNVELEKAKQTADKANQAKSAFLANMSHEIRTPMNAILGFSQILARDSSLKPTQAGHVQTIIRSSNHLLALINDILDVSKIEAGQATLNKSTFSLRSLIADLRMMFNSRAAGKGLQFLVECDDNMPDHALADESKLRQILINLLGNAIKFTTTGGVSVRLRGDSVDGKPRTAMGPFRLVGEVEDTGPGITDEDIPKIFNTFQQAKAGLKAGGTGLGLAISRGFARLMSGDITFTSKPGKGSCFRFNVLLESVESSVEIEHQVSKQVIGLKPGTGPFRVLVADDIPENRELMIRLLCPVGFEVQEAADGTEAIKIFETWAPHIVLMDLRMPVMDGYEAIQKLRTTEVGRAIPIVAVTASVFEDNKKQVMQIGADAFLRKPFRPEELFAEIGKLLNLHYVFADKPANNRTHSQPVIITPEALSALPHELLVAMQQAVADGDIVGLMELIDQAAEIDSATASGLQVLANQFDYPKLTELLANAGEKDGRG